MVGSAEIFTMLVLQALLMNAEFYSEDACRQAAIVVSQSLHTTVFCIGNQSGDVIEFRDGSIIIDYAPNPD